MKIRSFAALLIALFSLSLMTGCATGNLEAQLTKNNQETQNPVANLTAREAETIAIEHAQVGGTEVILLPTELDYDDGAYEVEFFSGDKEYEYKINAKTGEILHSKVETEPASAPQQPVATEPPAAEEKLTREWAEEIALNHAGLTKDQVTRLKTEFDYDDGRPEYSVEFRHNGWEYDYEIHAQTGKILDWDKEYDD